MYRKRIESILDLINKNNEEDFYSIFKNLCNEFNIEKFALAIFWGQKNTFESFLIYDTYPVEWMQRYKEKKYHLCDPVFANLNRLSVPFEWNRSSFDNLLPIQQLLMDEAYDFGIKSGVTVPLTPHFNFHGFVTLLNQPPLHPEVCYIIFLVANICVNRIIFSLEKDSIENLTAREIEILTLKAQGLPIKTIGHNLGISAATITFHLKNIRKKLKSPSTEHALFKFGSALKSK